MERDSEVVSGCIAAGRAGAQVRAAMLMRHPRSVTALALAQATLASDPAVRSRLYAMAAQASQAAFVGNDPESRRARGRRQLSTPSNCRSHTGLRAEPNG